MNKIFSLVCLSFFLFATTKAQTDTLINFFNPEGETLIPSPNGGFLSGSNGYNDSEKLQSFFPQQNYSVLGLLVWNGYVVSNSGSANSKISFKIRRLDTTASSILPFFRGPTVTLDSVMINISDLQEGSSFNDDLQFIPFSNPVLITEPYLAGFSLDSLARNSEGEFIDSFAIRSTAIDSALLAGFSWERWNGEFKRIIDTWGLNTDFAIFPVIDTTLNNAINPEISSFKVYPNPASDYVVLNLENTNTFNKAHLFDIQGRMIDEFPLNGIQGQHIISLSNLSSGYYTLRLIGQSSIAVAPIIVR